MTDPELYRDIVRRDEIENIAAVRPPTFKELDSVVAGNLAVQADTEIVEIEWDNFDDIEVVSTEEGGW